MRRYLPLLILPLLISSAKGCSCDEESPPTITTPGEDAGNNVNNNPNNNPNSVNNNPNNLNNNPNNPEDAGDNNPMEDAGENNVNNVNNPMEDVGVDADEPWPWPWPEPACTVSAECAEGEACVGGGCAAPVEASTYEVGQLAVVTDLFVPGSAGDTCCFDLDNDGEVDNTLSELVALYEAQLSDGTPLSERVFSALEERNSHIALEFRGYPEDGSGSVSVGVMVASSDVDSDGTSDFTREEVEGGLASLLLDPLSFGAYGATLLFPALAVEEGVLSSTAADFAEVLLPLGERCAWSWQDAPADANGVRCRSERPREARFARARIAGQVVRGEDGRLMTAPLMVEIGGGAQQEVGSVQLGGYVHLDLVADVLSAAYGDNCACIGVTPEQDIFRSVVEDGRYRLECAPEFVTPDLSACSEFNRSCPGIANLCEQIGLISNLAEYDSDGDGVDDAVSFGFWVKLASAASPEGAAFLPPRELCDTATDEDGDGLAGCDDPECWDDVLCGAPGFGERCHDLRDNDGDGLVDCADPSCSSNRACAED